MKINAPVWLLGIAFVLLIKSADLVGASPLESLLQGEGLTAPAEDSDILLNYRLPNDTYPEHYDLQITTKFHLSDKTFQGEVVIDIVVVNTTNSIVLHARELEISKVNIVNPSTNENEELSYEYELEREFLSLKRKSDKQFKSGTNWKLNISYSGKLRDDNQGFYSFSDVDEYGNNHHVALTYFEKTNTRYAFPCYDEPAIRANFTITLNHDPSYTAISNMPVNRNSSRDGKTVFLPTSRIPAYIVAFVLCDFEYTELTFEGVRQRLYSRSSRKSDQKFSLVNGVSYMNYFAEYFGVDYMLSKLDHVAVTRFISPGMENWGLITYDESFALYNWEPTLTRSQIIADMTVAHELAHQWIGNYVAIRWWNNVWLKEGLAHLFSFKAMAYVFRERNVWHNFHILEYQEALMYDTAVDRRPLTADVRKPSDITYTFDEICYFKSVSVLRMWENALGEEVFKRAMQTFLKNNQYSAVTEEDLYTAMNKSAEVENLKLPAPISEMLKTWTHQGGYPILTVTRNYSDGSFIVKQETFFSNQNIKANKTWYVPINFVAASEADFRDTKASHYLANSNETKIDAQLASSDWVIFNKQSEYFYRITYDEENYKLITQALIEHPFKIHLRNRAQLLYDAVELSLSNRLNVEIVLKMLTYLKKEDQYAPWLAAKKFIRRYRALPKKMEFRQFIKNLIRPTFNKLGVYYVPGENHYDKYTRDNIIDMACWVGLEECLMETKTLLKAHLIKNVTIDPEIENTIFSSGLMQADDNEFDIVYQMLMKSPDEGRRGSLIYFLSSAQNEGQIKKLISSSIDMENELLPEERYNILKLVYGKSDKNLLACIEFLSENWDDYGSLKGNEDGPNPLDKDIRGMSKHVYNEKVEEELLTLVEKVKDSKYVSKSLQVFVQKQIALNYQWMEKRGEPILSWISQNLES